MSMEVLDPVVRCMRECGIPIETQTERKQLSLLHRAVALGQVETFGKYREFVNAQDAHGLTPLHYAVLLSNLSGVRDLLQLGADPNITDTTAQGYSPLHLASKTCNVAMVKEMLSFKEIMVDLPSKSDGTALHIACRSQFLSIIEELVEVGADVNKQDPNGLRPLHIICLELVGNEKLEVKNFFSALADGMNFDVNAADGEGRTGLHCAAASGNREAIVGLLLFKPNVSLLDKMGRTPLHYAACSVLVGADSGSGQLIPLLIQAKVDVSVQDCMGLRATDILRTLFHARAWRKGESTALSVALRYLESAEETIARAAAAEAARRELEAEEDSLRQTPSLRKKGTRK